MSENSFEFPRHSAAITWDLGPALWSCRDRSEQEKMSAVGHKFIGYYFAVVLCPLLLAAIVLLILFARVGETIPAGTMWALFGLSYAAFCGAGLWWLLRRPKESSLVLHERGFRFKRTVVMFDQLALIRLGRPLSAFQSSQLNVNRQLRYLSPISALAAALLARAWEGCVILVFQDGRTQSLNGMLIRPQPDDLKQFFVRLRTMHPNLVEDPRSSPQAAWLASAVSPSDSPA